MLMVQVMVHLPVSVLHSAAPVTPTVCALAAVAKRVETPTAAIAAMVPVANLLDRVLITLNSMDGGLDAATP